MSSPGGRLLVLTRRLEAALEKIDAIPPLSAGQIVGLARHVEAVEKWSERLHLVSRRDVNQLVERHTLDSLMGAVALNEVGIGEESLSVADVGSGAGFPGIPLAIARPQDEAVLFESSARKAGFLVECVRLLDRPNLAVRMERLLAYPQKARWEGKFEAVLARGVAPARWLAELTLRLAVPGGVVLWWKGPAAEQELAGAADVLSSRGQVVLRLEYCLPGDGITREITAVKRITSRGVEEAPA